MNYSKQKIGNELRKELNKRYNIENISTWACDLLVEIRNDTTDELDYILDRISLMDAGPEFEYTKEELTLLAEKLINNEDDPIKQIDDIKFKESK